MPPFPVERFMYDELIALKGKPSYLIFMYNVDTHMWVYKYYHWKIDTFVKNEQDKT